MDIKIISHIAKLSYLELPQEKLEQFAGELHSILEHISQLNCVDVAGVTPTAQAALAINVFREDISNAEYDKELVSRLIKATPETEDRYVKVKAIL